ncbi:ABC transporter ATP-binding protein (plasmid) [Mesorhizobium sp. ORM8.1]
MEQPVLSVRNLTKHFPLPSGMLSSRKASAIHAVDGVSFDIGRGETLSIVGESGCGKSTVGRAILRLTVPTSGEVWINGARIDNVSTRQLRPLRKSFQVVFQDPFSSLNPRMYVRDIIAEPLLNFSIAAGGKDVTERIAALLKMVGLPREAMNRRPHEFSGGQRQRIGIARALAAEPEIIVCDEAVSALDVSVKAQIVNLLGDLQNELGLAILFISHDLAIVEHLSQRVAVMYLGVIVEIGSTKDVFLSPNHPYTKALLESAPVVDPGMKRDRRLLKGEIPSPIDLPVGCRFASRCPFVFDRCRSEEPALLPVGAGHLSACHLNSVGPSRTWPKSS